MDGGIRKNTSSARPFWRLAAGRWLLVAVVCAALALGAGLAWLSWKARVVDSSGYFHALTLVRDLKQLDASWELRAARPRENLPDAAIPSALELASKLAELEQVLAAQPTERASALRKAVRPIASGMEQRRAYHQELTTQRQQHESGTAVVTDVAERLDALGSAVFREYRASSEAADVYREYLFGCCLALLLLLLVVHAAVGERADR